MVAISGGEAARAEQRDPVKLTRDEPAVAGINQRRRMLSVVVPLLNEEATLEQLGIELPKLSMEGAHSPLGGFILQTNQLTQAQRMLLPTERELQLANAELAREYRRAVSSTE